MLSYMRNPSTAAQYTGKRVKLIALPFFICLVFRCLLNPRPFISPNSFDSAVVKWSELLYTLSFSEAFGVNISPNQLLVGSWYFSVLVIASFLLYGMLEFNERLATRILFPAISLLGLNALLAHSDNVCSWSRVFILGSSLVRGCSEMATGALICSVYQENKPSFEKRSVFINIMGIFSFIVFVAILFTKVHLDKFIFITVPWILLAAVIDGSWLNKWLHKFHGGMMSRIGQYTLYILCAHYPAIIIGNWCNEHIFNCPLHDLELALFEVLLVIPTTILLYTTCKWIRKNSYRSIRQKTIIID